jgi:hypothetical protein
MKKKFTLILVNSLLLAGVSQAQQGEALSCEGNGPVSAVIVPSNNTLEVTEYTVETWFNWSNSGSAVEFIFSRGNSIELHTGPSNNSFRFIPVPGVYLDTEADVFLSNTWNHLAVVYNPTDTVAKIYVNGAEVSYVNNGSSPISTAVSPVTNDVNSDFLIGQRVGGSYSFNGIVDEFRFWNRALSLYEIQQQMNCEIPGASCDLNLLINMHFNQGIADGNNTELMHAIDDSGYDNNGLLQQFGLMSTTSNFTSPGAVTSGSSCVLESGIDTHTACGSFVWMDGNTYTASNTTATYTIEGGSSVNGCDSLVTLNLTLNTVNTGVTLNANTLTATQAGATYQWVDCSNNFAVIGGATNQSFSPSTNGNYAAIVTLNNCSDTTACTAITTIGIDENSSELLSVYPNPSSGKIQVELKQAATVEITSLLGEIIHRQVCTDGIHTIDLTNQANGVYLFNLHSKSSSQLVRIVIQH